MSQIMYSLDHMLKIEGFILSALKNLKWNIIGEVYAEKTKMQNARSWSYIKSLVSKGTQWFQVNMFKGVCVMFHDSLL